MCKFTSIIVLQTSFDFQSNSCNLLKRSLLTQSLHSVEKTIFNSKSKGEKLCTFSSALELNRKTFPFANEIVFTIVFLVLLFRFLKKKRKSSVLENVQFCRSTQ